MTPAEAIQILEQFERLDEDQVAEISGLIDLQATRLETQALVLAARDKIIGQQQIVITELQLAERRCAKCEYFEGEHCEIDKMIVPRNGYCAGWHLKEAGK